MKITKTQLRRLIRKEMEKMNESADRGYNVSPMANAVYETDSEKIDEELATVGRTLDGFLTVIYDVIEGMPSSMAIDPEDVADQILSYYMANWREGTVAKA